jgi:hypothetical protein
MGGVLDFVLVIAPMVARPVRETVTSPRDELPVGTGKQREGTASWSPCATAGTSPRHRTLRTRYTPQQ